MGKIINRHGNIVVRMSFEELLAKGFPQEFAILDLNSNVPELRKGNLENVFSLRIAINAIAARIVREKLKDYNGKMPSRANIELKDGNVEILLGGWSDTTKLQNDQNEGLREDTPSEGSERDLS